MALQNMHRRNLIKRGAERLINLQEFFKLVNDAYSFLHVSMDQGLAETVFKEADKDGDGHITYV